MEDTTLEELQRAIHHHERADDEELRLLKEREERLEVREARFVLLEKNASDRKAKLRTQIQQLNHRERNLARQLKKAENMRNDATMERVDYLKKSGD